MSNLSLKGNIESIAQVSKDAYDTLLNEKAIQDKWLNIAVARQMESLDEENKSLKEENNILKGRVEETDKRIADIKEETDRRISEANKRYSDGAARQKGVWESQVYSLQADNRRLNTYNKSLESDKAELETKLAQQQTLIESRDEEIQRLQSIEDKIDTLYTYLLDNIGSLKDMLEKGGNKNEIKEALENIEDNIVKRVKKSKAELEQEDRQILKMLHDGMTKSDIADIVYSHIKDHSVRTVQLSKRLASKRFKELENKEN